MTQASIIGHNSLVGRENYEEHLKAAGELCFHPASALCICLSLTIAGVGLLHRKTAMKSEPTIEISVSGDRYEVKRLAALKSTEDTFHLGQEFEHQRFDDGAKVTSVFNLEGNNKLLETQQAPG